MQFKKFQTDQNARSASHHSPRVVTTCYGFALLLIAALFLTACAAGTQEATPTTIDQATSTPEPQATTTPAGAPLADVVAVEASGEPGGYTFRVTVSSPDTGCDQYADWWEVVSLEGELLYRRVLLHSHVNEQPFQRSGGPVPIQPETQVWVRAHMNNGGYGGQAYKGSVADGFEAAPLEADFAADLAQQPPLPEDCAF